MSSSFLAQILAGGLLAAFFALRPLHRLRPASFWLGCWGILYLAALLKLGDELSPVFPAAAVAVGTLHPPLLFNGACELSGRPIPRWLIPAAAALGVARFGLTLLGYWPVVLLSFAPVAVLLEVGSGWVVWRHSGETAARRRRVLAMLLVVYAAVHGAWLIATARAAGPPDLLISVWFAAALLVVLAQLGVLGYEQRAHQQNLVALNERLGRMLERSSDLVAWAGVDRRLHYVNPALAAYAALDETQLSSTPLSALLSPDSVSQLENEAWPQALAGNTWQGELTLRGTGPEPLPVSTVIVPQHGPSGGIEAIGCLMRDLTERARIEEDLRRRVGFEHQIARISTELLLHDWQEIDRSLDATLEAIGSFLDARQAWIFLLKATEGRFELHRSWQAPGVVARPGLLEGVATAQLPWLFRRLRDGQVVYLRKGAALPPEAVFDRPLAADSTGGNLAFVPLRLRDDLLGTLVFEGSDDGRGGGADEMAPVRLAADFVTSALGRHRSTLLIQEREAELRQAQKMEAVGQLAGGVAHDFNNLLTVIAGYAEVLQADAALSERQRGEVEQILIAAERASTLTSQLLAFSRRQILEPHAFDLNERLEGLRAMLRRTVGERIELVTELASDLPLARADPSQIDQVVVNLVVNSRDAIDGDGTIRLATARVHGRGGKRGEAQSGWVRLSVIDDGCGMDPETRSRIFEPFFTTKKPGEGTGLGLSTAYGILTQSGGAIDVLSDRGAGTTVHVYLPVAEGATEASPLPRQQPVSGNGARSGTLLLVEDEAKVRALLRSILEEEGFEILEARDGKDALEILDAHGGEVDLVVTDVVMPHLGGAELVAELRNRRGPVPALFLSGYPSRYGGKAQLPGTFLDKPFTRRELLEAVDSLLGSDIPSRHV